MANSLKRLQETAEFADVQRTSLAVDVFARYVCNTFQEARDSTDPTIRPDARPFSIIIIGGGTFGAVIAEHLWFRDTAHRHRILVLEGGPSQVSEHVQNKPMLGLVNSNPTTLEELWSMTPQQRRDWERVVWGLPWHANAKFPGLAYCIGGRSIYWGGWSPRPLPTELPPDRWTQQVVDDLDSRYFDEAARQIGVTESNDFIFGELHDALRQRLFDAIEGGDISEAIGLDELPLHLESVPDGLKRISRLEAPLAVQGRAPRAGYFAFNKFSSVPLLCKASRAAQEEAHNDDVRKRLMIVPNCHVTRLVTQPDVQGHRVVGVKTNFGDIEVPVGGLVVIALGTVESTRLALLSFSGLDAQLDQQLGKNFMAHLRSNLNIRIPRDALVNHEALAKELATSALFVKCRQAHADGTVGHYHLQITASGLGAGGSNSEAEMWQKVPDIDGFEPLLNADDTHVVITIRGIGEMTPDNLESHVTLDLNPQRNDEFGERRAYVTIAHPYEPRASESPQSTKDRLLWDAMDRASDQIAKAFANGKDFEVLTASGAVRVTAAEDLSTIVPYTYRNHSTKPGRRDGMGSTHHEAGTLRLGDDPAASVTNPMGRFHAVGNAYVTGPALFPTIGSPNPMLTGIALARRAGDNIMQYAPPQLEAGFESIFNGTRDSFSAWRMAGSGQFSLIDGAIVAYPDPTGELGLLWYPKRQFGEFTLRLEFTIDAIETNSGVFVRFRDPRLPVPDPQDSTIKHPYRNQAWVAISTGYEVQIDEWARPDGQDPHRTGAIYNVPRGASAGEQDYQRGPVLQPGQWYECEISVGLDANGRERYRVSVGGKTTTSFVNNDPYRGKPPSRDPASGYLGLQAHTGQVRFRNIRCRETAPSMVEAKIKMPAPSERAIVGEKHGAVRGRR